MAEPARTFLSIGECMLEFSRRADGAFNLGYAGDTLNTACYFRAAAGDAWHVQYFTRLGSDVYSAGLRAFLESRGIATHWIASDPHRLPGLYLIETRDGERSFSYWRSQSAARLLADDEPRLRAAIAAGAVLYFSGITLAILAPDRRQFLLEALAAARAAGKTTVFDPNIRPRLWQDAETLRQSIAEASAAAAIVLPSYDDERAVFADASLEACAGRYRAYGAGEVVVKNGGGPVCAFADGRMVAIDGLDRVEPLDSTGAGDAFNGAYLAARLSGDSAADAIRKAHVLAARVVRHPGALLPPEALA